MPVAIREVLCRADGHFEYRYPGDEGEQCSHEIVAEAVHWLHYIGVPIRAEQQGLLSLSLQSRETEQMQLFEVPTCR